MRRSRTVVVTSVLLVAVLGLLSVIGFVGFSRLRHSIDTVNQTSARLTAYQAVERSLASEAFAEAGYRRAPNELSRERVLSALAEVEVAVDGVNRVATAEDEAGLVALTENNRAYAQELRAQLGPAGSIPRVGSTDKIAGPALDAMQGLVDVAVDRNDAQLHAATANQRKLINKMAWRAPLVLVLAFVTLTLCWGLLVAYGRRNARRADVSEQLALHDPLTGLANRRAFERLLAPELARQDPDSAVLLIDLDDFKAINDTWGHEVGDDVLRAVAQRLQQAVRGSDFVTRIGGDEFAVLARPALQAEALRERLQEAINRPLQLPDVVLQPAASIGWAAVVRGASQEEVLRAADRRLYDRKRERATGGRRIGEQRIPS
jgi:diguanylate cyclase (GGDEF)-like protein